jgi:hypothetical protein
LFALRAFLELFWADALTGFVAATDPKPVRGRHA